MISASPFLIDCHFGIDRSAFSAIFAKNPRTRMQGLGIGLV